MNKFIKRWFRDTDEKLLFRFPRLEKVDRVDEKMVAIQTPADHYYLALFAILIANLRKENPNYVFVGIYPETFTIDKKYFFPISLLLRLDSFLIKLKWKKMYNNIGIEYYLKPDRISIVERGILLTKAISQFIKFKSKDDLLKVHYKNIKIGDLIYDTYLRFEVKPTIVFNNLKLIKYLYRAFFIFNSFESLIHKNKITVFYSSYSTYIQHGVPVRLFLNNSISVYTSGNLQQKFKKLSTVDYFHTSNHSKYNSSFSLLPDQSFKIELARNALLDKFAGKIDQSISYMRSNSFNDSIEMLNFDEIEGVLFLHDFFDSPHIYDGMLFSDFYEWTLFTLDLIVTNNLKVAVKPHPNQIGDSIDVLNKLKIKYPTILWLNPSTSNNQLLKSNIKYGISLYGTVLHELAYFEKIAISAGNNPHSDFDFILKPKDIKEYVSYILNYQMYNLPVNYSNQVEIFYYMHNLHSKEPLEFDFSCLDSYNVFNADSSIIPYLLDQNVIYGIE